MHSDYGYSEKNTVVENAIVTPKTWKARFISITEASILSGFLLIQKIFIV